VSQAPRQPDGPPPPRRPGSVRRTSTVLMTWPDGLGTDLHLTGRCRDLVTPFEGEAVVANAAELVAVTSRGRTIERITSEPEVPGLDHLVGASAGGKLRAAIARELPDEVASGTPVHLLLDDLAGSTLISGFAYFRRADQFPGFAAAVAKAPPRMTISVCSGFRPGASSLSEDGTLSGLPQNVAPVGPLADPADPEGWHRLDDPPGVAMRRARRIDVWSEGDQLIIDSMFRDSCWDPDGSEVVVHEYRTLGTADRATGTLTAITALPRVLPYVECPMAAPNAEWMVGTPMRQLRRAVLERLRGEDCCTHLNDALRALAEVPVLAEALAQA
jgi:hypothetical protein